MDGVRSGFIIYSDLISVSAASVRVHGWLSISDGAASLLSACGPRVHASWYRRVVSQLYYLTHQLFFSHLVMLSELEPKEADYYSGRREKLTHLFKESVTMVFTTITHLIRVSDLITLLEPGQLHRKHAAHSSKNS